MKRNNTDTPRKIAIRNGDKTYFTGKPCKRGHIAPRYVSTTTCLECNKEYQAEQRKTEHHKAYMRDYMREYEKTEKRKEWRKNNRRNSK